MDCISCDQTKTSKAAVCNIAQCNYLYLERFVNNPATALDITKLYHIPRSSRAISTSIEVTLPQTKLSNFATNANKAHKQKIATAVEKHGSASFNKTTRELKDSQGEVVGVFPKPVKRKLADVLGPELAGYAKVKRARRPRQARMQARITNDAGNLVPDLYNKDPETDEDLEAKEGDNSEFDDYGYGNHDDHYSNQVGGSAGVGSSNQSQHYDEGVYSDQFPASYHVSSEEFRGTASHQQTNNALASGIDR